MINPRVKPSKYAKYRKRVVPILMECYPAGLPLYTIVIRCGYVSAITGCDTRGYNAIAQYLGFLRRKGVVCYMHGVYTLREGKV